MSAGRKSLLLLLLVLLWPGEGFAQVKEVKTFKREMKLQENGARLEASFFFPDVFTPRFKKRLSSGFTSHVLVGVQLLVAKERVPLAQGVAEYTILYDIWEEKFAVRVQGVEGQKDLVVPSMEDLVRSCATVDKMQLTRLLDLPADVKVFLEVRIQINPTSPEQLRKVREYLANPDGSGRVGGAKFFGSFSRIFVDEKDFQAEAVYTYRSPELTLPSR